MKIYSLTTETGFVTSIKTDDSINISDIVNALNSDLNLGITNWEDKILYSESDTYYLTLESTETIICIQSCLEEPGESRAFYCLEKSNADE